MGDTDVAREQVKENLETTLEQYPSTEVAVIDRLPEEERPVIIEGLRVEPSGKAVVPVPPAE